MRRAACARVFGLALTLCVTAGVTFAARVAAQSVVLVRPAQRDPAQIDAFNRLAAELHLHHFESIVVDDELGEDPAQTLAAIAQREQALAAIAVLYHDGRTALDVWLVDRLTGKTSVRRIDVAKSADASSLIAVRAVDLLRASLLELAPGAPPPRDVIDADRGPIPIAASELAAEPERKLSLAAEAAVVRPGQRFGFALGPSLGLFYRTSTHLELGASFVGPLVGTSLATSLGTASVQAGFAALEARFYLLDGRRFRLAPLAAAGGYLLFAEGQPSAPRTGVSGHAFAAWLAAGVRFELVPFSQLRVGLALRIFTLAPRIAVAVADQSAAIDRAALEATLGLAMGL